tara:strand:- start:229 stop:360 length:132 start_codon:yes stop_codon:yes gene_type:complete
MPDRESPAGQKKRKQLMKESEERNGTIVRNKRQKEGRRKTWKD